MKKEEAKKKKKKPNLIHIKESKEHVMLQTQAIHNKYNWRKNKRYNNKIMNSYIDKTSVKNNSKNSRNENTIGNRKARMIHNNWNKNSNKIKVWTQKRYSTNKTNDNKRNNRMMKIIVAQTNTNKTEYLLLLLIL